MCGVSLITIPTHFLRSRTLRHIDFARRLLMLITQQASIEPRRIALAVGLCLWCQPLTAGSAKRRDGVGGFRQRQRRRRFARQRSKDDRRDGAVHRGNGDRYGYCHRNAFPDGGSGIDTRERHDLADKPISIPEFDLAVGGLLPGGFRKVAVRHHHRMVAAIGRLCRVNLLNRFIADFAFPAFGLNGGTNAVFAQNEVAAPVRDVRGDFDMVALPPKKPSEVMLKIPSVQRVDFVDAEAGELATLVQLPNRRSEFDGDNESKKPPEGQEHLEGS